MIRNAPSKIAAMAGAMAVVSIWARKFDRVQNLLICRWLHSRSSLLWHCRAASGERAAYTKFFDLAIGEIAKLSGSAAETKRLHSWRTRMPQGDWTNDPRHPSYAMVPAFRAAFANVESL